MSGLRTARRRRCVCIVLACVLLLGALASVFLFPGRWYLFFQRHRWYPALQWEKQPTDASGEAVSLETLLQDERVTLTNTMLLVNETHPLPADYQPMLTVYRGIEMHPQSVKDYTALAERILRLTGENLLVRDDYRTEEEQRELIATSPEGIAAALGCSEHEAGLALDVCVKGYGGASFLKTWAGVMTNLLCSEYGYVIRYPLGKEDVTGIKYEPWHLRYVGAPHAKRMMQSGLTLEEYLEALTLGVWYRTEEYMICRTSPKGIRLPQGWQSCEISPDNCGYYVITLRMS